MLPPERDVLERMRASDPDLYARALSGERRQGAGAGLALIVTGEEWRDEALRTFQAHHQRAAAPR